MTVSNDLRACSSALFVMAERTPRVKKYRDVLETVISGAMDFIAKTADGAQPTKTADIGEATSNFTSHEQQAVQSLLGLSSAPQTDSHINTVSGASPVPQIPEQPNQQPGPPANSWQQMSLQEPLPHQLLQADINDWPMEPLFDFRWQNDQITDEFLSTPLQANGDWQTSNIISNFAPPPPLDNVWAGDRHGLHMINQLLSLDTNEATLPP